MKMRPNSKKGWILEVDLEYPEELHDWHNDYPLAPEKKAIGSDKIRVRIPAAADGRLRFNHTKHREAGANAGGQRKICAPLQELAVLSQSGNATEESPSSDRVRPRAVDGAIHQDEHGVSKTGKERFRNRLLQSDEQLGVWQDDGEPEKPC